MFFFLRLTSFDAMNYQIDSLIMKYIHVEMMFQVIWLKSIEVSFCDFEFDVANKISYSIYNYHDYGWEYQIFMIYDKLFIKFDAWVIIMSHQWSDDIVKKKNSFWRKIDISMKIMRWNRAFTCIISSSFLSLWKLCRETTFAIIFSCMNIQTMTNSISKIMVIKRMICNEHIAKSWIKHLLISCITLILSQYKMSFSCDHYSYQRMKMYKMTNISLKLIYFLR